MNLAFVKKGILLAVERTGSEDNLWYLDFNNPAFSGGPVIFPNHDAGDALKIGTVVSENARAFRRRRRHVVEA